VQAEQNPGGLDGDVAARGRQPAAVLRLVVEEALARLPAGYQEVIELRVEGYDVAEIARRTGRSKRTVERILQESRRSLHDLLSEDG
jgi:RNA polymerase sigma factor (sigma-70 family)